LGADQDRATLVRTLAAFPRGCPSEIATEALGSAARLYENQAKVQVLLGGLFLEPLVVVGVLGGVVVVFLALFLPMIKLLNNLM